MKRLLILLVATSLLAITGYWVRVQAIFISHEAESGSLSGNAIIADDQLASNGKYVLFNSSNVNTNFQPTAPYYGTFFYEWYKTQGTDGSWSYWPDHGNNPPNTWFSKYLPDPKPGVFDPSTELYSSNDYANFKWQVAKMAEAHIEVSIASWFGPNTKEDIAFDRIINDFMGRSDNPYSNLRWAMYYEDEGFEDPSVTTLVSDLNLIKTKYANSPYMLKVGGKPVVFVYAGANDIPGTMTQRWKDANTQLGNYFYINLKVFPGYVTDANQPSSWHQYSPASRSGIHSPYSAYISPGFFLDDGVSAERLVRNATDFETAANSIVSANVTWKLVETWNEWGEGTSVEPGTSTRFNSTTNKDEPDPNGYPFGNLYIDILNRTFPALEQGTGSTSPTSSPISGTSKVVAVAGDMVCGAGSTGAACKHMETSQLAVDMNPDAVIVTGDVQYEQGAYSDFQNFYHPSWGRLKDITYPVVGNHEYLTSGASGYFDYFNGIGMQTGRAGDRSKGYYAIDVGAWRIYVLNTNCSQAGGCGAGSPQEQWLRADLAQNPRACAMAGIHHPLWTSGSRVNEGGDKTPLFQALYDFNVDVVVAGHEHNYERFAPMNPQGVLDNARGLREFVIGNGGRNFTKFVGTAANSEVKNDATFGVVKFTLHANSYDFEHIPIPGSTFTDKQTNVGCH